MTVDDEGWVRVGSARNVTEAALLRHALEARGIDVRTTGEHLPSIAGELPLPEARVQLWAREKEADRARQILDDLARAEVGPERSCPKCGEQNPGSFDVCWNCETPLDE